MEIRIMIFASNTRPPCFQNNSKRNVPKHLIHLFAIKTIRNVCKGNQADSCGLTLDGVLSHKEAKQTQFY